MTFIIGKSGIQAAEHKAFQAAWKLAEIVYKVYQPGFWEKEDQKAFYLSILPLAHRPGALCTTGAVALYTDRGLPLWIETPWGEWNCFGGLPWQGNFRGYSDGKHPFEEVCKQFEIDRGSSTIDCRSLSKETTKEISWMSHLELTVKRIGDITLPPREREQATRAARGHPEWIAMCMYYYTVKPKDREQIFQWLQAATASQQNAFSKLT